MSPFSQLLYDLRKRYGVRQAELAVMVGYEQSYISALESSLKGPPTPEFVDRLIRALKLPESAQQELHDVMAASHRKLDIAPSAPTDIFLLLRDLRAEVNNLSPSQVRMIRDVINLRKALTEERPAASRRTKHRTNEEARM